jgi:phage terminase large subunit-like protein
LYASYMKTVTLILPRLHRGQRKVVDEARRFNVLACGRRFGKSTLGEDRIIHPALDGYPTAWFSPTYKMLSEIWRDLQTRLRGVTKYTNMQERRIELVTGGSIEMWSLDKPDVARGRKYKRVVIDEASIIRGLDDAWQAVIRPTLADFRGDAFLLGTPKGDNFFKQAFEFGQSDDYPDWMSWQLPTETNPIILPEEIEALRRELPARLFEQEILARFIGDMEGALWTRSLIDSLRVTVKPRIIRRVVVGVDPKIDSEANSETGIVVAALAEDGHAYILDDMSIDDTPNGWAKQAITAYYRYDADEIVAEVNQGGDLVASTLRSIDKAIPITTVRASKGKYTRAQPVASLYEEGQIHHVGKFTALENQMCNWLPGDKSPDRLDAMVWAIYELLDVGSEDRVIRILSRPNRR